MQELIDTVSSKTGISKDQAQQAIEVVLDFLEKKLPKPIAGQLRGAVTGNAEVVGQALDKAGEVVKGIGGVFGGSKSK